MSAFVWHLQPDVAFQSVTADESRILAHGARGEVTLANHDGQVLWCTDQKYPARAVALGAGHVLSVHTVRRGEWNLRATRFEGSVAWETSVHALRVARLFADRRSRVLLLANRDGSFRVDVYGEDMGARRHTQVLDRRRALVDSIGRRVWTRDEEGCSAFDLPAQTVARTGLQGNGPMTAHGSALFTVVGRDRLVCVSEGQLAWSTEFSERDLTAIARAEDMLDEGEDADRWPAELGRPFVDDTMVLVADLSGRLHALDRATGTPLWRFDSAHYPSSARAAMPSAGHGTVAYPASDEHLYLLDATGRERARFDLGAPFEGACLVASDGLVLVPGQGVRAYG